MSSINERCKKAKRGENPCSGCDVKEKCVNHVCRAYCIFFGVRWRNIQRRFSK